MDHLVHGSDLKPENLLLDPEGHIRITDFGLSKENVQGDTVLSLCGTPEYLAPEIIKQQPYGKSVDWWSLGTLIYEMITGLPPFYDSNRKLMYHKILNAPLQKSPYMSPEAFDICSKLLEATRRSVSATAATRRSRTIPGSRTSTGTLCTARRSSHRTSPRSRAPSRRNTLTMSL